MTQSRHQISDTRCQKLRDYAFWLLAKREWSVANLREKLETYSAKRMANGGETPHDDLHTLVEEVTQEFIEHGWVSDERFCEGFVRDQISKQNGPIKIKFNARKYGLDSDLLDQKLEALYPEEVQLEILRELKDKREKRVKAKNDFELKAKLTQYLAGKGFRYDVIKEVI